MSGDNGNKIELSGIFSEGYGIIPKKLMRSKDIGLYEKAITAYMLSYTGGGNECFPSYKRIAEDLNISEPTIAKSIKRLVEKGYIRKEKLYPEDRLKHNNKYILAFMDTPILNEVKSHATPDLAPHSTTLSSNNNTINNNNKKKFTAPTIEDVKAYIEEHSYSVDPKQFWNYYNEGEWKDAKGNPVRNWKQRVITWHGRAKKDAPKDTRPTTVDEIRRAYAR